jgi:hypothetical protein
LTEKVHDFLGDSFPQNQHPTLQRYLEVSPEQKKKAVSVIGW